MAATAKAPGADVHASTQPEVCVNAGLSPMKYGFLSFLKNSSHSALVAPSRHGVNGDFNWINRPPTCGFSLSPLAAEGQPDSPGSARGEGGVCAADFPRVT